MHLSPSTYSEPSWDYESGLSTLSSLWVHRSKIKTSFGASWSLKNASDDHSEESTRDARQGGRQTWQVGPVRFSSREYAPVPSHRRLTHHISQPSLDEQLLTNFPNCCVQRTRAHMVEVTHESLTEAAASSTTPTSVALRGFPEKKHVMAQERSRWSWPPETGIGLVQCRPGGLFRSNFCTPSSHIQRHGYCTLGEAFNRLDFSTAILDSRRFNYVVRVSLKNLKAHPASHVPLSFRVV